MSRCLGLFHILFALLLVSSGSHGGGGGDPVDVFCHWNNHEMNCDNLTRLDEIYFDNQTLPLDMDMKLFDKFVIRPLSPILFDMNVLLYDDIEFRNEYELSLANFNGFEMKTSERFNSHFNRTQVHLTIANSTLSLVVDKVPMNVDACPKGANFFSRFRTIELLEAVWYPSKICREVFNGVGLKSFALNSLSPANSLMFAPSTVKSKSLNSAIEQLVIRNSRFYLSSDLLDEQVFFRTKEISIESSELLLIEETLFDNYRFPSLTTLRLGLTNFEEFFSHSGTGWMVNLNRNAFKTAKVMTVYLKDELSEYQYPDKDICLFKDWPHDNLVFPVLDGRANVTECTCTMLWLIKTWPHFDLTEDMYMTGITRPCFETPHADFNTLLDKCEFEERLSNCSKVVNTNPNSFTTPSTTASTTTATSESPATSQPETTLRDDDKDSSNLVINLTVGVIVLSIALSLTVISFVIYFFRVKIKERIAKMRIKKDEISFATFVSSLNSKDYYFVNRST